VTITQENHTTDELDKDGENDNDVISELINKPELIRPRDLIKADCLNY